MNMYEYSENNNIEMGIGIGLETDPVVFSKALSEYNHILENSVAERRLSFTNGFTDNLRAIPTKPAILAANDGYCIHCTAAIDFNPNKPYCDKCFNTWNRYGNADYEENTCHGCGQDHEYISMNIPQCSKCYKAWKKGERAGRRKTG